MADSGVGNSSTSENGQLQSDNRSTRNDEENESKSDNDKNETQNVINNDKKSEFDGSSKTTNSNNVVTTSAGTATSSLFSFCRSEGSRLNHSSSPLRPSVLGGGCSSSSSSSSTQFGSASICSPIMSSSPNSFPRNLFAKSSLSCLRPSENRSPVFQKPVLRPSQLASPSLTESPLSTSRSPNPFVLNPPKLANPFAKANESNNESVKPSSDGDNSVTKEDDKPVVSSSKTLDNNAAASPAAGQQTQQLQQQSCSKTPTTSVAFVPLTSTPGSTTSSTPIRLPATSSVTPVSTSSATPGGFVFGQNLHERVFVEPGAPEASTSSSSDCISASSVHNDVSTSSTTTAATNGTSTEMLFASVIKKELPDKTMEGDGGGVDDGKGKKSLTESAREYEESRAVKRKYEEVTVVTGEEEENNILQMDCKLFVYDGSKFNYSEGVHGSLRVNDPPVTAKKVTQSRVIVRMSGTLRVLMNTKIWAGMKIEKPNRKIVRMTAMDSIGQIKVFLISSSPSESDMLYRVLESRIKLQKELTGACRNGSVDDADKTEGGQ